MILMSITGPNEIQSDYGKAGKNTLISIWYDSLGIKLLETTVFG